MKIDKKTINIESNSIQELDFTWWYVWSWLNLGIGLPFGFMKLLEMKWGLASIPITFIYGVICVYMLKYNRYAFVATTVLTLNPILWIINGIYVKNRWMHPKVISGSVKEKIIDTKKSTKVPVAFATLFQSMSTALKNDQPSNNDYATVAAEIASGNIDEGLWTRCFVEADGDENRTLARYIKARTSLITETSHESSMETDSFISIPEEQEIILLPASSLELQRNVEQGYLNKLYGGSSGWTLVGQSTFDKNDRVFDKLEIILSDGRKKTLWFDITQAWSKTAKRA